MELSAWNSEIVSLLQPALVTPKTPLTPSASVTVTTPGKSDNKTPASANSARIFARVAYGTLRVCKAGKLFDGLIVLAKAKNPLLMEELESVKNHSQPWGLPPFLTDILSEKAPGDAKGIDETRLSMKKAEEDIDEGGIADRLSTIEAQMVVLDSMLERAYATPSIRSTPRTILRHVGVDKEEDEGSAVSLDVERRILLYDAIGCYQDILAQYEWLTQKIKPADLKPMGVQLEKKRNGLIQMLNHSVKKQLTSDSSAGENEKITQIDEDITRTILKVLKKNELPHDPKKFTSEEIEALAQRKAFIISAIRATRAYDEFCERIIKLAEQLLVKIAKQPGTSKEGGDKFKQYTAQAEKLYNLVQEIGNERHKTRMDILWSYRWTPELTGEMQQLGAQQAIAWAQVAHGRLTAVGANKLLHVLVERGVRADILRGLDIKISLATLGGGSPQKAPLSQPLMPQKPRLLPLQGQVRSGEMPSITLPPPASSPAFFPGATRHYRGVGSSAPTSALPSPLTLTRHKKVASLDSQGSPLIRPPQPRCDQ